MKNSILRLALVVAFMPTGVLAQGAAPVVNEDQIGPVGEETARGTGVNIFESLNPEPPTETVTQADDDDYPTFDRFDPYGVKGFSVGPFTVFPSVTGGLMYDDNVFALANDPLSDWIYIARPQVTMRSNNWQKTNMLVEGFVEFREYDEYKSENQNNGSVGFATETLVNQTTQVVTRGQYVHGHESRGVSRNVFNLFFNPIAYDQLEGAAALNKRFGRYWTSVGGSALDINYGDGVLFGIPIPQDYRSGDIEKIPMRAGYVVAPGTSIFVEGAYNERNFDVDYFSSDGYRVVGGLLFEPVQGANLTGEVFAGYMNQDYNGFTMLPVSTWTAGGALTWIATEKMTVTASGRREALEASFTGGIIPNDGISVVESVAIMRADYRVMTNVVVGGGLSYIRDDYNFITRTDEAWGPLASVKYFINPTFTVGFDYRGIDFESRGIGLPSYDRNVYLISGNARF